MNKDELLRVIDNAIRGYQGDSTVLGSAIGALHIGLLIGWRPLRLIHSHRTFVRYEQILGLDFHAVLPEVGPLAHKSVGWRLALHAENFWDAVRGSVPGRSKQLA